MISAVSANAGQPLWQVSCLEMQALPHGLPFLHTLHPLTANIAASINKVVLNIVSCSRFNVERYRNRLLTIH
jgi:hypothetical protein